MSKQIDELMDAIIGIDRRPCTGDTNCPHKNHKHMDHTDFRPNEEETIVGEPTPNDDEE